MALALTLNYDLSLSWTYTNALDLSTPEDRKRLNFLDSLASGTGLDQADRIFHDSRSISTGANDDLDLAGGLTDAFGTTLTFVKIKGIFIKNTATTAGEILNVGGGSAHFINWIGAAGDIVKIGPDGLFVLWNPSAAGYAVTATTADILRITNAGAGTIVYQIILVGTSS